VLWKQLPEAYRHLFNAILWEGGRFQRFLMGPSSIDNHHNDIHGNLRHAIEVAELACALAKRSNNIASVPMATFAGLIHDVAKADEYKLNRARGVFEMSDQGTLIGHRDRLQHWISSAVAKYGINLPGQHLIGLLHALTAAKGAPAYLGLREPRSIEATILTTADRMSGEADFYRRLSDGEAGFGEYHHHLGGRPFITEPAREF
jgi:3'-5' exoribonuclease